jgi:CBS domain-containing protein
MNDVGPEDPVWMVMSTPAAWIDVEASLLDVAEKLLEEGIGLVVVQSPTGVVGVVSERDIARALALGGEPSVLGAAELMADRPLVAHPDEPILDVATRMVDGGVRHLPVVEDGRPIGVVSLRDVVTVLTAACRAEHGPTVSGAVRTPAMPRK